MFCDPFINASWNAVWQRKVAWGSFVLARRDDIQQRHAFSGSCADARACGLSPENDRTLGSAVSSPHRRPSYRCSKYPCPISTGPQHPSERLQIFEPAMSPEGVLASSVGRVIGVGAGRGISLLFIVLGGFLASVSLYACLSTAMRYVETDLPDQQPPGEHPKQT